MPKPEEATVEIRLSRQARVSNAKYLLELAQSHPLSAHEVDCISDLIDELFNKVEIGDQLQHAAAKLAEADEKCNRPDYYRWIAVLKGLSSVHTEGSER